jgi:hypothetical protein
MRFTVTGITMRMPGFAVGGVADISREDVPNVARMVDMGDLADITQVCVAGITRVADMPGIAQVTDMPGITDVTRIARMAGVTTGIPGMVGELEAGHPDHPAQAYDEAAFEQP